MGYSRVSYLTLDVDYPMSISLGSLEKLCGFRSRKQPHGSIFFLEQVLRGVVQDEVCALLVRLETKFFSNETDVYIGLVTVIKWSACMWENVNGLTHTLYKWLSAQTVALGPRTCPSGKLPYSGCPGKVERNGGSFQAQELSGHLRHV